MTPSDLLELRPVMSGCRIRHAGRPGGDQRMQGRECRERTEAQRGLCIARRAREDAAPVRHRPRQPAARSVELLSGRIRSLPRGRPGRGPEPGRVPLAQRRWDADRPGGEGEDQGLETDLGRGGVEGLGPGSRGRRRRPARDGHGDAGRAGGRGPAQGRRRQGRRGRRQARRAGCARFRSNWSAGTTRRCGTASTALSRT